MNKTRQRYYWFCLAAYELRQDMTEEEWSAFTEWSYKFIERMNGSVPDLDYRPGSPDDEWPADLRESWESLK